LSLLVVLSLAFLRWALGWLIFKRTEDVRIRYRANKIVTYTATTLGVFLLGSIWFTGFHNLSTFLGLRVFPKVSTSRSPSRSARDRPAVICPSPRDTMPVGRRRSAA
jgi:hypothetical protein